MTSAYQLANKGAFNQLGVVREVVDRSRDVEHYIDVYLDTIGGPLSGLGYTSSNSIARLIEFGGEIPVCGYTPGEIRPTNVPEDYNTIKPIVDRMLNRKSHAFLIVALLASRHYQGLIPDSNPPQAFNDQERARRIGQDLESYRSNVKDGRRLVKAYLRGWE